MGIKDYKKGVISYVEIAQAMIDGLKAARYMKNFTVDMGTFGTTEENMCYGCAATSTMMQLTGKKVNTKEFDEFTRYSYFANGLRPGDVAKIEYAVDIFRRGGIGPLLFLCKVKEEDCQSIEKIYEEGDKWMLDNRDWLSKLNVVQRHINKVTRHFDLEWYEV